MSSITWLHLSDMQIYAGSKDILDTILEDIKLQIENKNLRPELIFVTGDISSSAQKEEYEIAILFFEKLLSLTKLNKKNLLFVPGNHDYDRKSYKTLSDYDNSPLIEMDGKSLEDLAINQPLNNYNDFITKVTGNKSGIFLENQFFYIQKRKIANIQFEILGIDTSWVEKRATSESERRGKINSFDDQLMKELLVLDTRTIRIVLMHHSPENISLIMNSIYSTSLRENSNFILNGHAHFLDNRTKNVDKSINIANGSVSGVKERPNIYNFVKIDLDTSETTVDWHQFDSKSRSWIQGSLLSFSPNFKIPKKSTPTDSETTVKKVFDENALIPRAVLPGYANDTNSGPDRLNITSDVNAFAMVIASKQVEPPLCLGLFGDWGSGKTFFMNKIQDRIALITNHAKEKNVNETAFCTNIVHINFNAWHYSDVDLWASLVGRIFDGLADYITTEENAEKQKVLFKDLESAKLLLQEAEKNKRIAEAERNRAQQKLEKIQRKRVIKSIDLKELRNTLIKKAMDDGKLKNALTELSHEIGTDDILSSAEDVQNTIKEFETLRGKSNTIIKALIVSKDRWWRILIFATLLIIIPCLPVLINSIALEISGNTDFLGIVGKAATQLITFIGGSIVLVNNILSKSSRIIKNIEDAKDQVEKILEDSRTKPSIEEINLIQEINGLVEREVTEKNNLQEIQSSINRIESEISVIKNFKNGRELAQFIRERISSEEYRKRLGIISIIRKDLESLSDILMAQKQKTSTKTNNYPRIDRIVLYIDDLDRCPEDRVVQVLQAIHLLLAFKLFVVIVGVDSRWLLHSLESSYPTLQKVDCDDKSWMDEEKQAWETTPQNYLEKIFQIPFNLPVMDKNGFGNLIDSLIPSDVIKQEEENNNFDEQNLKIESNNLVDNASQKDDETTKTYIKDETISENGNKDTEISENKPEEESGNELFDDQHLLQLTLSKDEEEFIKQLHKFISTPRTAKRLVNIYYLIRARMTQTEQSTFLGDSSTPGEYKSVLLLLAILIGYQKEAPYIFREINQLTQNKTWEEFIRLIRPRRKDVINETANSYFNDLQQTITQGEYTSWKYLYSALLDISINGKLPSTLDSYRKWSKQISRFSFRLGKSDIFYDQQVDVKILIINSGNKSIKENIVIGNIGENDIDLTGWRLSDQNKHMYVFPLCVVKPQEQITIWSTIGNNENNNLYCGQKTRIWTKKGVIVNLYDSNNVLISSYPISK